jgi:hypothetical protein
MLQARRSWVQALMRSLDFFSIDLIFLGSNAQPAHKADNLTAIFEPTVKVMWDP